MSKAFTRESDNDVLDSVAPPVSPLPPGAKNYMTPDGAASLQKELAGLIQERSSLVGSSEVEAKRKLQSLDQRIVYLQHSLQSAVVSSPPPKPWEQVRFGATVTVRDSRGEELKYRIVGVDEMDVDCGWVSWLSPIAKALVNAKLGQKIRFRFPAGEEQLEIAAISYE